MMPATAPVSTTTATAFAGTGDKYDKENKRSDDKQGHEQGDAFFCLLFSGELAREAGNQGIYRRVGTAKVVFLHEVGDHLIPYDPPGIGVVDSCFQSIAGGNEGLPPAIAHLGLDKDDGAVVFAFLSYLPFLAEAEREVGSRVSPEIAHRDHV